LCSFCCNSPLADEILDNFCSEIPITCISGFQSLCLSRTKFFHKFSDTTICL
jgi:hypothetical protein